MKQIIAWLFLSCLAGDVLAQLKAGDVAVIAYNTDSPDAFAWVAFRDVPANTAIHFTNSSVSNGWFRWGDHLGRAVAPGPLTWSSPNVLPAGTVVSWVSGTQKCWNVGVLSGGVPSLGTDGDQLIAYTGSIVSNSEGLYPWIGDCSQATLLFALNFANAGWDNLTGGGPNTSYVPPGLSTNLGTAVHVNNQDDGYYSGIRTGTVSELRTAISLPGNWTTSANAISPANWPSGFLVRGLGGVLFMIR
ncbi:MAG: hypothetical protein WCI20_08770 [bacterium]